MRTINHHLSVIGENNISTTQLEHCHSEQPDELDGKQGKVTRVLLNNLFLNSFQLTLIICILFMCFFITFSFYYFNTFWFLYPSSNKIELTLTNCLEPSLNDYTNWLVNRNAHILKETSIYNEYKDQNNRDQANHNEYSLKLHSDPNIHLDGADCILEFNFITNSGYAGATLKMAELDQQENITCRDHRHIDNTDTLFTRRNMDVNCSLSEPCILSCFIEKRACRHVLLTTKIDSSNNDYIVDNIYESQMDRQSLLDEIPHVLNSTNHTTIWNHKQVLRQEERSLPISNATCPIFIGPIQDVIENPNTLNCSTWWSPRPNIAIRSVSHYLRLIPVCLRSFDLDSSTSNDHVYYIIFPESEVLVFIVFISICLIGVIFIIWCIYRWIRTSSSENKNNNHFCYSTRPLYVKEFRQKVINSIISDACVHRYILYCKIYQFISEFCSMSLILILIIFSFYTLTNYIETCINYTLECSFQYKWIYMILLVPFVLVGIFKIYNHLQIYRGLNRTDCIYMELVRTKFNDLRSTLNNILQFIDYREEGKIDLSKCKYNKWYLHTIHLFDSKIDYIVIHLDTTTSFDDLLSLLSTIYIADSTHRETMNTTPNNDRIPLKDTTILIHSSKYSLLLSTFLNHLPNIIYTWDIGRNRDLFYIEHLNLSCLANTLLFVSCLNDIMLDGNSLEYSEKNTIISRSNNSEENNMNNHNTTSDTNINANSPMSKKALFITINNDNIFIPSNPIDIDYVNNFLHRIRHSQTTSVSRIFGVLGNTKLHNDIRDVNFSKLAFLSRHNIINVKTFILCIDLVLCPILLLFSTILFIIKDIELLVWFYIVYMSMSLLVISSSLLSMCIRYDGIYMLIYRISIYQVYLYIRNIFNLFKTFICFPSCRKSVCMPIELANLLKL